MFHHKKIRVIVVDDSKVVRKILSQGLSKNRNIEVIATAEDPYEARDLIVKLKPDVITLDLEMPKMSGLEFINVLMKHWPLPIVVVSSRTKGQSIASLKALELGAVDVFAKPNMDASQSLSNAMSQLAGIVLDAAYAKVHPRTDSPSSVNQVQSNKNQLSSNLITKKVIAIGASTGGTEAIREVIQFLPAEVPGIIVTQHMPEGFTHAFAKRMNELCSELEVCEASDGDAVRPGLVLIAPGNQHMVLVGNQSQYYVKLKQGPKVCRHRPSVDVLFQSVANVAGKEAVGVILTGMGADGANGLLAMRKANARTMAQDETSCVVYGMPKEAMLNGAAEMALPINQISSKILKLL